MAKPIIDILIEISDIRVADATDFNQVGYEAFGENGITGRRFFIKGRENRTHHLHMFEMGNKEVSRHLNFRDYLISHPEKAMQYSNLKEDLAQMYPFDIESYIAGKDQFIKQIDVEAKLWNQESP